MCECVSVCMPGKFWKSRNRSSVCRSFPVQWKWNFRKPPFRRDRSVLSFVTAIVCVWLCVCGCMHTCQCPCAWCICERVYVWGKNSSRIVVFFSSLFNAWPTVYVSVCASPFSRGSNCCVRLRRRLVNFWSTVKHRKPKKFATADGRMRHLSLLCAAGLRAKRVGILSGNGRLSGVWWVLFFHAHLVNVCASVFLLQPCLPLSHHRSQTKEALKFLANLLTIVASVSESERERSILSKTHIERARRERPGGNRFATKVCVCAWTRKHEQVLKVFPTPHCVVPRVSVNESVSVKAT